MISGVINVYKEKGYTSHDVVAKLRGILRQKKIGHTGTLDPEAQGVLPVCLGAGTKLCDMLTDTGKTYEAVMLLGQVTDTQDTTGKVLESRAVSVDADQVRSCLASFVGAYDQIPPMYSALKVQGKKLYELARAGIEVERKPRPVQIHGIEILRMELPEVTFSVDCSKGTYIRTLCHDAGEKLGCGGCMKSLIRTRSGMFRMEDSLRLDEIEQLQRQGRILEAVYPVDTMFPRAPKVLVRPEFGRLLLNGNPLKSSQLLDLKEEIPGPVRVYLTPERFCGLYRLDGKKHLWVPEKMFLEIDGNGSISGNN